MAEEAIVNGEKNGCPVTGVIVEPIQVNGDRRRNQIYMTFASLG